MYRQYNCSSKYSKGKGLSWQAGAQAPLLGASPLHEFTTVWRSIYQERTNMHWIIYCTEEVLSIRVIENLKENEVH